MRDKSERFWFVLSPEEKEALNFLTEYERVSSAAVVRRLIWREAVRVRREMLATREEESEP